MYGEESATVEKGVSDNITLPAIGTVWIARDGRRLRVEGWTRPVFYPQDDYWSDCTVLNPQKGQRRATTMSLKHFGKFLTPASASSH